MRVRIINLSRRQTLQRFVRLTQLIELLLCDRIFLPTLESLRSGDPFEGSILPKRKRSDRSADELRAEALQLARYLPSELKWETREEHFDRCQRIVNAMTAEQLAKCVADLEARRFSKGMVCSCWYGGKLESDAM